MRVCAYTYVRVYIVGVDSARRGNKAKVSNRDGAERARGRGDTKTSGRTENQGYPGDVVPL